MPGIVARVLKGGRGLGWLASSIGRWTAHRPALCIVVLALHLHLARADELTAATQDLISREPALVQKIPSWAAVGAVAPGRFAGFRTTLGIVDLGAGQLGLRRGRGPRLRGSRRGLGSSGRGRRPSIALRPTARRQPPAQCTQGERTHSHPPGFLGCRGHPPKLAPTAPARQAPR
jgi:hypothetical protein